MPIKVLNQTPKALTAPKAGLNSTGTYFPGRSFVRAKANPFGPNQYAAATRVAPVFSDRRFGQPSRAGIGTTSGHADSRLNTSGTHPFEAQFNASTMKRPTATVSGQTSRVGVPPLNPALVSHALRVSPQDRTGIGANTSRDQFKRATVRTAFGASRSMPSDTAFKRLPIKVKPKTLSAPSVDSTNRFGHERHNTPSFNSRANLWSDPNNSFQVGAKNVVTGALGVGRWQIVKKGAE